jgi:hypothetical protein
VSNVAEVGYPVFEFGIARQYYPSFDFGWFKDSVHGALETALKRFADAVGAEDFNHLRRPKGLERAYECLALRLCKGLSPDQISSLPEYSRDWTTLAKDIKSAAELAGIERPRVGRPTRKVAR